MNAINESQRRAAQASYDHQSPPEDDESDDFVSDFSDSPALWLELFLNMEHDQQIAHMRLLNTDADRACARMHDEARHYLYELIAREGLEHAQEVWG